MRSVSKKRSRPGAGKGEIVGMVVTSAPRDHSHFVPRLLEALWDLGSCSIQSTEPLTLPVPLVPGPLAHVKAPGPACQGCAWTPSPSTNQPGRQACCHAWLGDEASAKRLQPSRRSGERRCCAQLQGVDSMHRCCSCRHLLSQSSRPAKEKERGCEGCWAIRDSAGGGAENGCGGAKSFRRRASGGPGSAGIVEGGRRGWRGENGGAGWGMGMGMGEGLRQNLRHPGLWLCLPSPTCLPSCRSCLAGPTCPLSGGGGKRGRHVLALMQIAAACICDCCSFPLRAENNWQMGLQLRSSTHSQSRFLQ